MVQDIMEVIKDQECAEKPFTCSQFVQLMLGAEVHRLLFEAARYDLDLIYIYIYMYV